MPGLRRARTWKVGGPERSPALRLPGGKILLGHHLAAQATRTTQPFVTRLQEAWLVGKFASPVTHEGLLLPTAFRDEPRLLGLERHPELESWLAQPGPAPIAELEKFDHVWPMVNRLQTNYFHWLVEWCGRVEWLEEFHRQTGRLAKVLIPAKGPRFIRESLSLLGVAPDRWIEWPEDATPCLARNVILPSLRGSAVAPSIGAMRWLQRKLLAAAAKPLEVAEHAIYISRPRGGWRSVVNDEEVADWFRSEGHEVLQPQHLPLAEQISRFSRASLLVGLHGAGLTNILFAPQGKLLELTGSYGDALYYGIAGRLGNPYEALPCAPVDDDVIVDLEALKRAVARQMKPKRVATCC